MSSIQLPDWHAGFLQVLPAVETNAKLQFRKLRPEKREDAIQEAIASACVSYQILAAKGRLRAAKPATIAIFAVNYVRNHRHIGGHQDRVRDVMSPVCQHRHGAKVVSDADGWPTRHRSRLSPCRRTPIVRLSPPC